MTLNNASGDVTSMLQTHGLLIMENSAQNLKEKTDKLLPKSRGGLDEKPWHEHFPKGASDDVIKAFLAKSLETLDQVAIEAEAAALQQAGPHKREEPRL